MPLIRNISDVFVYNETLLDISGTVSNFKNKSVYVPSWDRLALEYYGSKHAIVRDKCLRPDDKIYKDGKKEKVARLIYEAEKLAVRDTVQMAFTNPVARTYATSLPNGDPDPIKEAQADAIERIYKSLRIDGENTNRMGAYFASCEIITIHYVKDTGKVHYEYGFPTPFKFRCRSYSPMPEADSKITQADLYPVFDRNDNLISLGFEYNYTDLDGTVTTYFEVYTDTWHYQWVQDGNGWVEFESPKPIVIGKIPGIYLRRPKPIWDGISNIREEIEFTQSRASDLLRKTNKSIVVGIGTMIGEGPKGDYVQEVYNVEPGGDMKLLTPPDVYTSVEGFTNQLKKEIREITQMPDLSIEALSGSGVVSGAARESLLIAPTLKIGGESPDIIEFFDRECNIIKAYLGILNVAWKDSINDLEVTHEIVTFRFNMDSQNINDMATGVTAGIVSKKTAIEYLAIAPDVNAEIAQIQTEENESNESQLNASRLI